MLTFVRDVLTGDYASTCGNYRIEKHRSGFKLYALATTGVWESLSNVITLGKCKEIAEECEQRVQEEVVTISANDAVEAWESEGGSVAVDDVITETVDLPPDVVAEMPAGEILTDSVELPKASPSPEKSKGKKDKSAPKSPRPKKGKGGKAIVVPETPPIEETPVPQVKNVTWQNDPDSERGEVGTWTHWVSECGTYRVTRFAHKTGAEWSSARYDDDSGKWKTLELDPKREGGNYPRKYATVDDALLSVYRHASSGFVGDVVVVPIAIPAAPAPVSSEGKSRVSAGRGKDHEAHAIVMRVITEKSEAGQDATMKDISTAVAAGGFVRKSDGKANTYYCYLNTQRALGIVKKTGKGYRLGDERNLPQA